VKIINNVDIQYQILKYIFFSLMKLNDNHLKTQVVKRKLHDKSLFDKLR